MEVDLPLIGAFSFAIFRKPETHAVQRICEVFALQISSVWSSFRCVFLLKPSFVMQWSRSDIPRP